MCGAAHYDGITPYTADGLSPRVRGSLDKLEVEASSYGSIPACAGQPVRLGVPVDWTTVYPRVCGAAPAHPSSIPSA